ncbi:hypothetical protein EVAR_24028_1 [Eumeta japonica]|uniref:Uncharacterized protein n=1 Tax=Eumeta variegata TaxID=151549 RepID=A0A4C1WCB4_EUMVA|nr:hypothetical protein EVAR_24028_1 [Eumeta japonica]
MCARVVVSRSQIGRRCINRVARRRATAARAKRHVRLRTAHRTADANDVLYLQFSHYAHGKFAFIRTQTTQESLPNELNNDSNGLTDIEHLSKRLVESHKARLKRADNTDLFPSYGRSAAAVSPTELTVRTFKAVLEMDENR